MNNVVVPDSVDPYIGYKWLFVFDEQNLRSQTSQAHRWPHAQPLEAECIHEWGWLWTVATTAEAAIVEKGWQDAYGRNGSYRRERCWTVNGDTLPEKPPKKPKILLPAGVSWSYERRPCPHEPVAEDCSCGIYAAMSIKEAERYKRDHSVLVRVALWGRVIIGDKGARGQYAYPQEIVSTHCKKGMAEAVGQAYGIPFPGFAGPGSTDSVSVELVSTTTEIEPDEIPRKSPWYAHWL